MVLRVASVTFDCRDPRKLAAFWASALHYDVSGDPSDDAATVEDPRDRDVELVFVRVPEGKTVKNRAHLDLGTNDMEAEVQRLVGLGASFVERVKTWTVLRDPEGNEFCVIQIPPTDPVQAWRT